MLLLARGHRPLLTSTIHNPNHTRAPILSQQASSRDNRPQKRISLCLHAFTCVHSPILALSPHLPRIQSTIMASSLQPAFTPVQARHTLQRTPQVQTQPTAQSPASRAVWPEVVRNWVQRAFAPENAIHGISPDEWRKFLLDFLPKVQATGEIDTIDWSTYPTPQQDRKSTRLNSSHSGESRMPSSA